MLKSVALKPLCTFFLLWPSKKPINMEKKKKTLELFILTVSEVKVMHMPPKPFIAKAKKMRMDRSEGRCTESHVLFYKFSF